MLTSPGASQINKTITNTILTYTHSDSNKCYVHESLWWGLRLSFGKLSLGKVNPYNKKKQVFNDWENSILGIRHWEQVVQSTKGHISVSEKYL